ncbi:MAG: insulinase family protein [Gemmatimonadales bacterium]
MNWTPRTTWRLGVCALLLTAPCRLQGQGYPTSAPAPAPLRPVRFPPFVNGRLANGLSTLVVEKHQQPVISITLSIPAGSFYDPDGKAGLASLVANLLTKGTERRSADQLSAEIEGAGGEIGAGADGDFLTINVSGLAASAEQLFDILGDVVQHASFPQAEVDLARTQALSSLQLTLSQPASIAARSFDQQVYGRHPYGRVETPASLQGLTREDVVGFAAARIKPAGAFLVVAGDIVPARVQQLAAQSLGAWTGAPPAAAPTPPIPVRTASEIVLVHKPGAVQSNIVAGFTFITPHDPNVYALSVVNQVLGGGADSRLFMILREQKGWTYGAYSGFSTPRGMGTFEATAEVRTPVTDSALGELLRQLNRIRNEPLPDSEVVNARNFLTGRFPLQIETADQIAGRVARARRLGLPDDYVLRYREHIAAVTRLQLRTAARRYITTDKMVVLVVGDGTKILAGLKAQGLPVRIVTTDGQPMTEADLAPRAASVSFVPGRVAAATFQYRVMVQGNAFGTESRTVTRTQEGGRDLWQIATESSLGPILHQVDTTVIDAATLAPVRVRQSGTQQGQQTFVRLDYDGGHVRGQAHVLARTGAHDVAVDTTVAPGVLDDNEIAAMTLALPFAAGAHWTLPIFSGGKGEVIAMTFAVVGEESVTVPAGTFACWKLDVQGGDSGITMYVAKENPTIVKLEIQGAPVAFELTQKT